MAEPAALAALAADNQGKFWEMHDAIFAMKSKITMEKITAAAQEIGLDMQKFNTDRNSDALRKKLEKDKADAARAEVRSTPSLYVNGIFINNRSLNALQQVIDKELAKQK